MSQFLEPSPLGARAALEALFTRTAKNERTNDERTPAPRGRLVVSKSAHSQASSVSKTDRLISQLVQAESRPDVTRAAARLQQEGIAWPRTQEVQLALLEHADESIVRQAIAVLAELTAEKAVERRTLLEARLRRLAEYAGDLETRQAADGLRKRLPMVLMSRAR